MENAYAEQVHIYRAVSLSLLDAITAHGQAHAAYEAARDIHDDKRAALILDGIPGIRERSPNDLREAALSRVLAAEMETLRSARESLRIMSSKMHAAQVSERMERETLRSYQAGAVAAQ
jgi:hypothetical protein